MSGSTAAERNAPVKMVRKGRRGVVEATRWLKVDAKDGTNAETMLEVCSDLHLCEDEKSYVDSFRMRILLGILDVIEFSQEQQLLFSRHTVSCMRLLQGFAENNMIGVP